MGFSNRLIMFVVAFCVVQQPVSCCHHDGCERISHSLNYNAVQVNGTNIIYQNFTAPVNITAYDTSGTGHKANASFFAAFPNHFNNTQCVIVRAFENDCLSSNQCPNRKIRLSHGDTRPVAASVYPEVTTNGQFNITADYIRGVPELVIQVLTSNGSEHFTQEISLRPDNGRRSLTVLSSVVLANGSYTVNVFIKKRNGTLLMVESGIPIHCVMKEEDDHGGRDDHDGGDGDEVEPDDGLDWWIYVIIAVVVSIIVSFPNIVAFVAFLIIVRNKKNSNNGNGRTRMKLSELEQNDNTNRVELRQMIQQDEHMEAVHVPTDEREVGEEEDRQNEHVEGEGMNGREVDNVEEESSNVQEHNPQPATPEDSIPALPLNILPLPVADTGTPDYTRNRQFYNPTPQELSVTDSTENSAACLISQKDKVPFPGSISHPTTVQVTSRSGTGFSSTTASETAALLPPSEHHTETIYLHENREEIGRTNTDLVVNSSRILYTLFSK